MPRAARPLKKRKSEAELLRLHVESWVALSAMFPAAVSAWRQEVGLMGRPDVAAKTLGIRRAELESLEAGEVPTVAVARRMLQALEGR